jgi:Tol biopolymer transport system component
MKRFFTAEFGPQRRKTRETFFKDGMISLHMRKRIFLILAVGVLLTSARLEMSHAEMVQAADDAPFSKIAFVSRQDQSETLHVIDPATGEEATFPFDAQSITWWHPVWSPTCDLLALDRFQGDEKVVSVLAYGGNGISTDVPPFAPIKLTAYFPSWSPDGKSFAFQGLDWDHPEGNFEIYSLSIPDGNITNLSNNAEYDLNPDWSPDGKQIAFVSITETDNPERYYDIYVMNADGSSMKAIYTDPKTNDSGPLWSPDGNSIAFITYNKSANTSQFLLTDKNGSTVTPLTDSTTYNIGTYAWSNDGKYIAFSSINADDDIQLFLLDVSSKAVQRLTDAPKTISQYPSWSPDDTQIVFQSNHDGDFEIYTLDVAGRTITQLTHNDYDDIFPAWSPKSCADTGYVYQGGVFDLNCPACQIPTATP